MKARFWFDCALLIALTPLITSCANSALTSSPASISLAMSFAYRGSDGQTAQQMRDVMHYPAGPEGL